MQDKLYEPCNLCFEREADIHLALPMYEGKVVDPSQTADYAFMLVCQECFDKHAQRQWDIMAARMRERHSNSKGVELIIAERRRQIEAEGWTPEHDDEHSRGELARAASCYIALAVPVPYPPGWMAPRPASWPWSGWWKPKDRKSNLIRAGALLLAEQDRLARLVVRLAAEIDQLEQLEKDLEI